MIVLIAFSLLVFSALSMLILRLVRPGFGYHWLIAAGVALVTWVTVLLMGALLPFIFQLSSLRLGGIFNDSYALNVDRFSWPFALGLGTLLLATLLTDVVRAIDLEWFDWAGSLLLTALGLIAVLSANLLTFILTLTAFDIVLLVMLMFRVYARRARRRVVMVFFNRLLGTMFLVLAGVASIIGSGEFSLDRTPSLALIFIVISAGLRLGAIPGDKRVLEEPAKRRSLGTMMRMVSVAVVFAVLVRTASAMEDVAIPSLPWLLLFGLIGMVSLLAGASWLLANDELDGRHAWMVGMATVVIASALRAQADASLAWSLATMFSGGLIFLASVRIQLSQWVMILGLLGISTLPFTPTWNGTAFFAAPFDPYLVLYLIALVLILWGYAQHSSKVKPYPPGVERWIRVIYPMGLVLLPVTQIGLSWFLRPALGDIHTIGWILGLLICVLASLGFIWRYRGGAIPQPFVNFLNSFFSLGWLVTIVVNIFQYFSRFINFVSNVLEGEGGLLWALLWIVLFLAILVISLGS
jgi:hypothetical protein